MKILEAECFEMRPPDRDYNKHGKPRNAEMEVFGGASVMPSEQPSCMG